MINQKLTLTLLSLGLLIASETGVFKLTDSAGIEQLNFSSGSALYLYLTDPDQNTNVLESETVNVNVISDTETTPELVSLYETGQNTGNFIGSIVFDAVNSTTIGDGKLQVQNGDKLTGTYIDPYDDFNYEKTITDVSLYGATTQSGTISENTTWSKANSPYLITGDVTVDVSITLIIDPGVNVRFISTSDDLGSGSDINRSELRIEGILRAMGTIEDSIIFTSNAEVPAVGDWSGIKVGPGSNNPTNGKALLAYCRIEYGSYGLEISGNTSTSDRDTILVENSLFQYGGTSLYQCSSCGYRRPIYFNNNTVINADAVHLEYEIFSVEIKNNTITNGRIYCRIQRGSNSVDSLYNNIDISGNSLTFSDNYNNSAIRCELDINGNILNINFNNNTIVGPVETGIRVYQNNSYTNAKTYLTMMGNQIDNVRHNGIYIANYITSALINNNTIRSSGGSYNNDDNSSAGSGIRISTNRNCNIEIVDNFIEGSGTWGMYLDRTIGRIDSNIVLNNGFGGIYLNGDLNYISSDTLTYNIITHTGYNSDNNSSYSYQGSGIYNTGVSRPVIHYNHLFDNYSYEIYNNTDIELECRNNFWGPVTNAEIAAANLIGIDPYELNLTKIYDRNDDIEKGWVNYGAYKVDPILSSPQIPVNLSAVENSYPAHLNWSPVTTINLLRYNIYRQDGINAWEHINSVYTSAGQDTLFRDITVRENTSYSYRITAESFENTESAFSNEVTITTGVCPTWYISSASGSDYNDGSFTSPFETIQKAVDTAYGAKDTLLVLPGTYLETVHIDENKSLIIGSQFMIDNDTSNVSLTIINGMQAQIGAPIWINDSSAVIKLIGLTLTGGEYNSLHYDNQWWDTGSGILISSADSVILKHIIIRDNQSERGGGIDCEYANYVSISNSWINNNESEYEGGGIYIGNVNYFEMYNNIISHNNAAEAGWGNGGGLYAFGIENVILKNNTFAFNTGDSYGAVYFDSWSYYSGTVWKSDSLLLFNNMFYAHSGADNPSNSERDIGGSRHTMVAVSNYFDENEFEYKHEYERYNSNIFSERDPFVNSAANNFALSDYSSAIGSGTLSTTFNGQIISAPSLDINGLGRPSPEGSNLDIGAYENILSTKITRLFHVAKGGSNSNSGSVEDPFLTIQHAVDRATAGDTILIAEGVYKENLNIEYSSVNLASLYLTTGDTSYIKSTIIDGDSLGSVITFKANYNERLYNLYVTGLTITGGHYTEDEMSLMTNNDGSGILIEEADSVLLDRVHINNNTKNGDGGGLSIHQTNYISIINSNINNNTSSNDGGGITVSNCISFKMQNSIIHNNISPDYAAGAVDLRSIDKILINQNTITKNRSDGGAHKGLYISQEEADSTLIMNSIISHNYSFQFDPTGDGQTDTTFEYGEQFHMENGKVILLSNYFSYLNQTSTIIVDENNIITPLNPFQSFDENDFALADYSLAINGGRLSYSYNGELVTPPEADYFDQIRPQPEGSNPDMGAIENPLSMPIPVVWQVKKDGSGDYTSIQSALEAAKFDDHILVYPGTYFETFIIDKNIILESYMGADSTAIDGMQMGRVIRIEDNIDAVIDGFTIRGGNSSGDFGGGIHVKNNNSIIKNCIIRNNYAHQGGGIHAEGGSFYNCQIIQNSADFEGGGIFIHVPNILFQNCLIANNRVNQVLVFRNVPENQSVSTLAH